MDTESKIGEFLDSLFDSERFGSQIVFQTILPATPPDWAEPQKPWPDAIQAVLRSIGIKNLYRHQAKAIDFIRSGRHVIVATPTASGKTLVYDLPVLEHFLTSVNFLMLMDIQLILKTCRKQWPKLCGQLLHRARGIMQAKMISGTGLGKNV